MKLNLPKDNEKFAREKFSSLTEAKKQILGKIHQGYYATESIRLYVTLQEIEGFLDSFHSLDALSRQAVWPFLVEKIEKSLEYSLSDTPTLPPSQQSQIPKKQVEDWNPTVERVIKLFECGLLEKGKALKMLGLE